MALLFLLLIIVIVFSESDRQIINDEFSFDMAQDFASIAYDVYYDYEVGSLHGRDKSWRIKSPTYCTLGERRNWREGYIYEYIHSREEELPICLLGVRGTENAEDLYQDAMITATKITDSTTGEVFFAHRGALELLSCYTRFSEYVEANCNKRVLYMAGHSLGGGIVNLLTFALTHGISVDFPGVNLDYTINKVEHNIQTYSVAAMKLWTLPYRSEAFDDSLRDGVMQYQNTIPCPSVLSENHAYRMYAVHRTSDSLTVDVPSLSSPLVLHRFCSKGYEVNMETGTLTGYEDTHAPDFTGSNYHTKPELHFSINFIYGTGSPRKVYVDMGCTEKNDIDLSNEENYSDPGMHRKVRCCSGKNECQSRDEDGICPGKLTYWKAQEFCEEMDMHVCKAEELNRCCGFWGDSCLYNNQHVWTSDVIPGTAENKVSEYPVLDANDPNCRGIHCEATQDGINMPKKAHMDIIYGLDVSVKDELQEGGHGALSEEFLVGASLRIPKEKVQDASRANEQWIPRYVFVFILGFAVSMILFNSLTKKKSDELWMKYESLIEEI